MEHGSGWVRVRGRGVWSHVALCVDVPVCYAPIFRVYAVRVPYFSRPTGTSVFLPFWFLPLFVTPTRAPVPRSSEPVETRDLVRVFSFETRSTLLPYVSSHSKKTQTSHREPRTVTHMPLFALLGISRPSFLGFTPRSGDPSTQHVYYQGWVWKPAPLGKRKPGSTLRSTDGCAASRSHAFARFRQLAYSPTASRRRWAAPRNRPGSACQRPCGRPRSPRRRTQPGGSACRRSGARPAPTRRRHPRCRRRRRSPGCAACPSGPSATARWGRARSARAPG